MPFNFFQKAWGRKGGQDRTAVKKQEAERKAGFDKSSDVHHKVSKEQVEDSDKITTKGKNVLSALYLISPHISEKATMLSQSNATYVFRVGDNASKPIISRMISDRYGVLVKAVR